METIKSLGLRDLVYIVILAIVFMFTSITAYQQYSLTVVYINNQKTTVDIEYFGTPFEAFGLWSGRGWSGTHVIWLWGSVEDIALFSAIAFIIVLGVTALRDWREFHGYYHDTV